jgi:hypothetical protein
LDEEQIKAIQVKNQGQSKGRHEGLKASFRIDTWFLGHFLRKASLDSGERI